LVHVSRCPRRRNCAGSVAATRWFSSASALAKASRCFSNGSRRHADRTGASSTQSTVSGVTCLTTRDQKAVRVAEPGVGARPTALPMPNAWQPFRDARFRVLIGGGRPPGWGVSAERRSAEEVPAPRPVLGLYVVEYHVDVFLIDLGVADDDVGDLAGNFRLLILVLTSTSSLRRRAFSFSPMGPAHRALRLTAVTNVRRSNVRAAHAVPPYRRLYGI
jgi:hypothetical protein